AELGERLQVQVVRVTRVVGGAAIAEPVPLVTARSASENWTVGDLAPRDAPVRRTTVARKAYESPVEVAAGGGKRRAERARDPVGERHRASGSYDDAGSRHHAGSNESHHEPAAGACTQTKMPVRPGQRPTDREGRGCADRQLRREPVPDGRRGTERRTGARQGVRVPREQHRCRSARSAGGRDAGEPQPV